MRTQAAKTGTQVNTLGEGVYKQHTSTRRVRRSIPPSNRLPVRGPQSARPLRSGRSVRKPAGESTIETYCVLPSQGGRRESHTPRCHTTVALRCAGPPPPGWRWLMSGAGSPERPIEPPSPPGTTAARRRRVCALRSLEVAADSVLCCFFRPVDFVR